MLFRSESVRFGYYSQQGLDFDEGKRVIDIVTDIAHEIHLVSPRTLQSMRENGTLAYTKISHKVYYRPEDVKAVFPVVEMKRCITAGKERKCNVTNKPINQRTNQQTDI